MRMPLTKLYTPLTDDYCLSEVGFFIIDDNWSEKSLIDLKHKTGLGILFGLQTTDKRIDKFEVIDGIIICESDEVQQVITVFESVLSRRDRVGIDFNNIRRSCGAEKPAKFIQARARVHLI